MTVTRFPGSPPSDGSNSGRPAEVALCDTPELVVLRDVRSLAAERFHRLKTSLLNRGTGGHEALLITSAMPGDGKSFVAMNLALALASEGGRRAVLIEADLRRPGLGRFLDPRPKQGLCELLRGELTLDQALLPIAGSSLWVLPAGAAPPDPVTLLSSTTMRDTIEALRDRFQRVLIDTPPALLFADADALGSSCAGMLLVVRAGKTPRHAVAQTLKTIPSVPLIGMVLNDADFGWADRNYGYRSLYDGYRRQADDEAR